MYSFSRISSKSLVFAFEKVIEKAVTDAPNLKKMEKQFKKQLTEFENDKGMLEMQLDNKNRELKQLHLQYRDKEVLRNLFIIDLRLKLQKWFVF